MKKLLVMLLCLMMTTSALAEGPLPEELLIPGQERLTMADAVGAAYAQIGQLPKKHLTCTNLVRLTDNTHAWVVSVYDQSAESVGNWTYTLSADDGEVLWMDAAEGGEFSATKEAWEDTKGSWLVWPQEAITLYERLYTLTDDAALPTDVQVTQDEACDIALAALGLADGKDYQIGCAMSGEAWLVFFVQEGLAVWQVDIDAATGRVLRIIPEGQGNG